MSKEKPEGEIVTFASSIKLDLTVAMKNRMQAMGEELLAEQSEITEQEELDLFDDLQWDGHSEKH